MKHEDFAAQAAYEALNSGSGGQTPWWTLPESKKDDFRRIAHAVQKASDTRFSILMTIRLPHQHRLSQDIQWDFAFGSSDEELEQAGKDFVEHMKSLRGG